MFHTFQAETQQRQPKYVSCSNARKKKKTLRIQATLRQTIFLFAFFSSSHFFFLHIFLFYFVTTAVVLLLLAVVLVCLPIHSVSNSIQNASHENSTSKCEAFVRVVCLWKIWRSIVATGYNTIVETQTEKLAYGVLGHCKSLLTRTYVSHILTQPRIVRLCTHTKKCFTWCSK